MIFEGKQNSGLRLDTHSNYRKLGKQNSGFALIFICSIGLLQINLNVKNDI